jgi:hypothetical protein
LGAGEVAIGETPIGDRPADSMDELADAILALRSAVFAVKVFADDNVGGQLAPELRHFAIGLLEQHLAIFAFDGSSASFPLDGVKRVFSGRGTKYRIDDQSSGPHL